MKRVCLLLLLCAYNLAADSVLLLSIDYAGLKENENISMHYTKGETALEALQRTADVKTKHLGRHSFVTSINEVASTPNKMGWFYKIDDKEAKKTASSTVLENVLCMKWIYRQDNCLSR
jgi:hypothetical protein